MTGKTKRVAVCVSALWAAVMLAAPVGVTGPLPQESGTQASSQAKPSAPARAAAFDPSRSDEKAIKIAEQMAEAMGGADTWASTAYIKFTFVVVSGEKRLAERTHYWDKKNQRSRMEGPSKEGGDVVAVVDHKSQQGQATINGQLLFDQDAKKFVDLAYKNLISDTNWLFMHFKLKDPGVRLRYEGEIKAGPVTYDKIRISFEQDTGLTSKDRYWLYVNRDGSAIDEWSYVLEGQGSSATPTAWQWVDWTTVGNLKLSLRKTQPDGEIDIVLENVETFDSLPDTVFTSTAPVRLP